MGRHAGGATRVHQGEGRASAAYATFMVRWRWLVLASWIGIVVAATVFLPAARGGGGGFGSIIPADSAAVQAARTALEEFRVPTASGTLLVIRAPEGLDIYTQADVVLRSLATYQQFQERTPPYPDREVLVALPLLNTAGLFPASTERSTTAVIYLLFDPRSSLNDRVFGAQQYAQHFRETTGADVYVTGTAAGRVAELDAIESNIDSVEAATLLLLVVVVGITFRSVVMPLLTLGTSLLAALVVIRVIGIAGPVLGVSLPQEIQPLLVALLLGIVTDYSIFFAAEFRDRLADGLDRRTAVHSAIRRSSPIVFAAGLTVAGGTAALYAADLEVFRSFAPGLTLTVLVGLTVAVTFIPALLAATGPAVFWPSHPSRWGRRGTPGDPAVRRRERWLQPLADRRIAAVAATTCVVLLVLAALPLAGLRLDLSFIRGLPADAEPLQGAQAASTGFAPGITGPTDVVLHRDGLVRQPDQLARLQRLIADQPGVAGVVGPASLPLVEPRGLFLSPGGNYARYTLYLDDPPLGPAAVRTLRQLQADLPSLVAQAGLNEAGAGVGLAAAGPTADGPTEILVGGPTAIASETAQATRDNLAQIALAAAFIEFVLLAGFLRSLVAPLYLLAGSALVVGTSLGLTNFIFTDLLGYDGLTFYVPFAAAVLLLALGSDYNVFVAGRIWEEARDKPLHRANIHAVASSSRAITIAGVVLAGSFALVALIPLVAFRELAVMMTIGLLIDTFIVRSVLTPALVTLVGPISGWPGRTLRHRVAAPVDPEPVPAGGMT